MAAGCAGGPPIHLAPDAPVGPAGGRFRVLEPPATAGAGPFPVVYFLHDFFGGDDVLWRRGVTDRLVQRMASGELPPFLLVAPQGDRGFWADSYDGQRRYEEWLTDQLPRQIGASYPVRPGPAGRAVVGISMGGYGAMKLALRRPQDVGAAAALSGLVPPLDWQIVEDAHPLARLAMKRTFGRHRHHNSLRRDDLYHLLPRLYPIPPERRPRLLVRAGTEDRYILDQASELFARVARDHGVDVELVLEPGRHDWTYWSRTADEVVAWAVRALDARCAGWSGAQDPPCSATSTATEEIRR
jgi:putative tributyrin esterase